MRERMKHRVEYDTARIVADMAAKGLEIGDVARATRKNHTTIRRFLDGTVQTTKTAAAIALALGYTPRRYLVSVRTEAA